MIVKNELPAFLKHHRLAQTDDNMYFLIVIHWSRASYNLTQNTNSRSDYWDLKLDFCEE